MVEKTDNEVERTEQCVICGADVQEIGMCEACLDGFQKRREGAKVVQNPTELVTPGVEESIEDETMELGCECCKGLPPNCEVCGAALPLVFGPEAVHRAGSRDPHDGKAKCDSCRGWA